MLAEGELASHAHGQNINGTGGDGWKNSYGEFVTLPDNGQGKGQSGYSTNVKDEGWIYGGNRVYTSECGSNWPHNNLMPLFGAYKFRRTN